MRFADLLLLLLLVPLIPLPLFVVVAVGVVVVVGVVGGCAAAAAAVDKAVAICCWPPLLFVLLVKLGESSLIGGVGIPCTRVWPTYLYCNERLVSKI